MKARYIVLTDIHPQTRFIKTEIDDIESLARLLLYANEIDLEGLIACTSCFVKKSARKQDLQAIHSVIDAYAQVRPNLVVHAEGYPDADYLRSITVPGISCYGKKPGIGFAHARYDDNPGVNRIIAAADRADARPLWIGLWGGANTLAQAVWKVQQTRTAAQLDAFLAKLRIYAISDQDMSGKWLRDQFGDRLFYIVDPSHGSIKGIRDYYKAVWPGIAADHNMHGSEDGTRNGGFSGARSDLISNSWLQEHVMSHGAYGARYPKPVYIMEGDTPSYLGLIPNGLNCPEHPDYGGWGGRYQKTQPSGEAHCIWSGGKDTLLGEDEKSHTSAQATIWRWREAFQNDFAARMDWTCQARFVDANHPPIVKLKSSTEICLFDNSAVTLDASDSWNPNGNRLEYSWFQYAEIGDCDYPIRIEQATSAVATFHLPALPRDVGETTAHIVLQVKNTGTPPLTRYRRIIFTITKTP